MTKSQKITLSASRDIPFNKLVLSQSNVRRVKAGVSIDELSRWHVDANDPTSTVFTRRY